MSEYYTAESYKKYERVGQPFFKNNKLYTKVRCKCDRCSHGIYAVGVHNGELVPSPYYNGVCLKCGGSGYIEKEVRLYNEAEHEQMLKQAEYRKKRNQVTAEERVKAAAKKENERKAAWLERNNFSEDGLTYCVFGDNTYAIKDQLKELGCKFMPLIGWHSATPLDLPAGYGMFSISCEDYMVWNGGDYVFKNGARVALETKFNEYREPSLSEYVGEVGERIRNLTVKLVSKHEGNGSYGTYNIFTFEQENNVLVWFSSAEPRVEVGKCYSLTATVKRHEEYRNTKTTQLSRCIIKDL